MPVPKKGTNTRNAGEDLRAGEVALKRGQPLRPAEIGMMASLGIGEVAVYRRLRVAFFSTGDELVAIGQPLGPGQIYDSNRYTIYGLLTRLGCEVLDMGVIRDTPQAVEHAFKEAAQAADVVMTSGGVSVGEADYVKQILDRLGEVLFWKIAMKPGRPLAYGKIGNAHFFGLPGNPVAVMVTFYQFVRDALLHLQGQTRVVPLPTQQVRLHFAHQESAGPHRISARYSFAGRRWPMDRTHHRRPGLGHSVLHEPGRLFHHSADRAGQCAGGRPGRGAIARRADLT